MQKLLYTVVHLLFWVTFSALSWMAISSNAGETTFITDHPSAGLMLLGWGLINFYTFYCYLQPRLLDSRRYVPYLFVSVGYSLLSSLLFVSAFWLVFESFRPHVVQKFLEGIVGTFMIGQCGSLLRGFVSWNDGLAQKTALENSSLKNELSMLKAQLSPHFLFNTLNNIDTLIYKSQDEASAMLIRLSELLRYMLYESDSKEVAIAKELEYLEQLTDLQKMRFEDPDFVHLSINNQNSEFMIAPLLLLPFVENAFKFVVNNDQSPGIVIKIIVDENGLHFNCENQFNPIDEGIESQEGGIGLINAQRRLALLYPNLYELNIDKTERKFRVDLKLRSI